MYNNDNNQRHDYLLYFITIITMVYKSKITQVELV